MTLSTTKSNGDLKENETEVPSPAHPRQACPYVGLRDDSSTWLAFPAGGNCCHFAQPAVPPKLAHQESYCLVTEYEACPMLDHPKGTPLPPELRMEIPSGPTRLASPLPLLGIAVILLLVTLAIGWWWSQQDNGSIVAAAPPFTPTANSAVVDEADGDEEVAVAAPLPAATASPTATHAPPTNTPTVLPTATVQPSPTASPTVTTTPSPSPSPSPTVPSVPPTSTPLPPQAIVNVFRANIRSGPGLGYTIISLADMNSEFTITAISNDGIWWQICCVNGGQEGWLSNDIVIIEGNTDEVPVITAPLPESITPILTTATPGP